MNRRRCAAASPAPALAALLALAAGCVTRGPVDERDVANTGLLVKVGQEVAEYYRAATEMDAKRAEALFNRIRPEVDAKTAVFQEALVSGRDDEKIIAAGALGFASSRKVVPYVVQALESPLEGVRINACLSLGTIGWAETPAEPAVKMLADTSRVVKETAGWTLSRILRKGQGSLYLTVEDIEDGPGLCARLARGAGLSPQPGPGRRIRNLLPNDLRQAARNASRGAAFDEAKRPALVRALNLILKRADFHHEEDFDGVDLPDEARGLIERSAQNLSDVEVQRLNRLLLATAYPASIAAPPGAGLLSEKEIADPGALLAQIGWQSGEPPPGPERRVKDLLPADAQEVVKAAAQSRTIEDDRRVELVRGLNAVLRARDFHQQRDFERVALSAEAAALLARRDALSDAEVQRLNRLILEASFPGLIGTAAPGRERGWALLALHRALDDEDPLVRNNAIIALRTIGCPESVDPILQKGLADNDARVRITAAGALGKIGDRRAVPPLIQSMRENQQDAYVLEAVKYALREITGQDFGGSYTKWRDWWEDQRRPASRGPDQDDAGKEGGASYDAGGAAGSAPSKPGDSPK